MRAGPFPRARHDHEPCIRDAREAAEALARDRGLRFTPLRWQVFEIVLASHRPIGAYDILNELARSADRRKFAPPTVYRALDFLMGLGLVHRIGTLSAYAACFATERRHHMYFLLCKACGCAAEIEDGALKTALSRAAEAAGFAAERETVEISGLCRDCAGKSQHASTSAPLP